MSLELEIDPVYIEMLERIDEQTEGDPKYDLEKIVENQIHESYQRL